ncbi:hypothetical protein JOD54_000564 [Actinokineospora baliensis]|uniref:DUF4082 domain-containing protein n=1 Tax=Actinokineospora baliensis TaxID=547056 RepID=UPI001955FA35|nr:DUF4082 domain-containing protein [Actinokineospora baliensis]MBM7770360.1 hypothetical protein [Actinokineospora baliensis]
MRRLVVLVLAMLLLVPGVAAAAAAPQVWVDLPSDNVLVPQDQPVTVRGHSRGVAGVGVKYTEIGLHDQNHFIVIAGAGQNDWEYTFTPGPSRVGPLTVYARVVLDDRQTTVAEVLHLRVGDEQQPGTCPCVFNGTGDNRAYYERTPLEFGFRFFVDRPGRVTHVHIPTWQLQTKGMTASLWTAQGALLARTSDYSYAENRFFTFATPIALEPFAAYVVSYTSVDGTYTAAPGYFTKRITNGAITAHYDYYEPFPFSAPGLYGAPGQFPRSTYNGTDYSVSPIFVT